MEGFISINIYFHSSAAVSLCLANMFFLGSSDSKAFGNSKWVILGVCMSFLVEQCFSFSTPPPPSFHNFHNDPNDDENNNPDWNLPKTILLSTTIALSGQGVSESSSSTSTFSDYEPTWYASTTTFDNTSLPSTPSANQIKQHTGNILQNSLSFWNKKIQKFTQQTKQKQSKRQPKNQENNQEELEQLQQTQITQITAPKSSIFSIPLLQHAGQQARLIGNTLTTPGVQHLAKILTQHYHRMGYPLCSVTGATLSLDGKCQVQTQEPRNFDEPVNIAFAKEMVIDDSGNTITFRQYKEQWEAKQPKNRRHLLQRSSSNIQKNDLNTTYVQTIGKTRNDKIAKAIGLKKGEVFRWDAQKWKTVVQSGIWDKVLSVEPIRLKDGSVQLRVICQECPRRHVEYGVTKSLYTGTCYSINQ